MAIVLGVIAGIVILGLLLLLVWKLITVLHDRAEYAKFENERLAARWDTVSVKGEGNIFELHFQSLFLKLQNENPIYKQATTTFRNPVYQGRGK